MRQNRNEAVVGFPGMTGDQRQCLQGRPQGRIVAGFKPEEDDTVFSLGKGFRGGFYVGLHKATREAAGVAVGDEVEIEIARDESPRVLELAPELEEALAANPELRTTFDRLSFSRRRELADPIRQAVKPETRAARLAKALDRLRAAPGEKRPRKRS